MFNVMAMGDGSHRIEGPDDATVGWIRGRAIRFVGPDTVDAAMDVALPAHRALEAVLRRQYPGWPHYEPAADRLRLMHDGAYEWISDGTAPIARVVRPRGGGVADTLGLEFALPSYASEGVAVSAALALARVLAPHLARSVPEVAGTAGAAAHGAT